MGERFNDILENLIGFRIHKTYSSEAEQGFRIRGAVFEVP
jgi:hypothetical protein